MAMIVQHNITAMNSNRMLGVTTGSQAKSTEKLSSGFKINRAADDAAGLTISEKMRKQIRGLTQASTNAQDGVSSVQTAEGALTEVHSMLQRMNQLATQAANGTNSKGDRDAIQAEIDQLTTEIDRVAETTKFNEIYLLKGEKATKTINMNAHDAGIKGELVDKGNGKATFTMDKLTAGDTVSIGGKNYTIINGSKQTEAVAGEDYNYTEAKNASVTINLAGWTKDADSSIIIGNMQAAIDGTTATDGAELVEALTKDADFAADYTASLDEAGNLVITAKDPKVKGADITADSLVAKVNTNTVKPTEADPVEATFSNPNGTKLYAEGGAEALTDEEAFAALKNGEKLYTTAAADFSQDEAEVTYTPASNASVTVDLTDWETGGDSSITVAGVTIAGTATVSNGEELAKALNADGKFAAIYTASADEEGNLVITANDPKAKGADVVTAITALEVDGTDVVAAGTLEGVDPVKASYTTTAKKLYADGGTEALTDEEILSALEKGEKLYSNAATREDSLITADEAYAKVKAELLKANQIGDVNGTAKVEFSAAKAQASDYEVGQTVTVGDKEYTIGSDKAEDVASALDEAIAAADAEAVGDTNAIEVKVGDKTYTYTTGAAAGAQGTWEDGDGVATDIDAVKAAIAVGGAVEISGGQLDAPATYSVINDETGTTISAEKAAELVNANPSGVPSNIFNITTGSADVAKTLSFNLHVGADADMTNKIQVDIDTMNSAGLGIKDLNVADQSGMAATYAIDAIQDAISKVSAQRSALGAVQNRLEHTIANVDNIVENTTAAESRIRDTDMAKEMVEYSKNNILAQAGQAMLAQANQSNQGVLGLLG